MINVKNMEQKSPKRDVFLWTLIALLFVGGLGSYYYFTNVPWALRATGALVLVCVIALLAWPTEKGQRFWQFAKSARMELRKVVWPTRQETVQTTLLVIAMVIIMALILWGIDSSLLWVVTWLTGRGN